MRQMQSDTPNTAALVTNWVQNSTLSHIESSKTYFGLENER